MTFFKLVKKSQYKEKNEPFNEHFKMPMLTYGPYASHGKISEFGVDGPFLHNSRFFIFQEFLNVIYKINTYFQFQDLDLVPQENAD